MTESHASDASSAKKSGLPLPGEPLPRGLIVLERLGVLLLLLAGLVPRTRDIAGSFDREMEGFQAACFASMAVNYERIGLRYGGYPILNIDLPEDTDQAYHYPNHPPLVPWLCWGTLHLIGPDAWDTAWERGDPPGDIELPLRLPFLLLHVAGLIGFWWAVRQFAGMQVALLALALLCASPISILYAPLINYENPCYALLLFGLGFHARWLRTGERRDLVATAALFFGATVVTFTPIFFLPGVLLHTTVRRGWRAALRQGLVVGACCLVPLVVHSFLVKSYLPAHAQVGVLDRARTLMGPLFDGSLPLHEWAWLQARRIGHFSSLPAALAAAAGAAWVLVRFILRKRGGETGARSGADGQAGAALVLALGGLLVMLGFYTHTGDGVRIYDGQTIFLLHLAPAIALLGAVALDGVSRPLLRMRGGFAPLVLVTSLVAFPSLLRANEIRGLWRETKHADSGFLPDGTMAALPREAGQELGDLVPPGTVAFYPSGLGLNVATSFYAWRTLIPTDRASWEQSLAQVKFMGLGNAPRAILLPRPLPQKLVEEWEPIRADLDQQFDLLGTSPGWELWPSLD